MKIERSIRDHYSNLWDIYDLISKDVEDLIKASCEKSGWIYISRIKTEESYALKLTTGREVNDFFACSIIIPTIKDVSSAINLVSNCLNIIDQKPKKTTQCRPTEFQFDSIRLYCKLKNSVNPIPKTPKQNYKFEVQIKTLLEQAWSQATHDFSYKGDDISWAKERIAAQLKAMLDNIELSVSQISSLSSAPNLDRVHKDYKLRAEILHYLKDDLGKTSCAMPSDLRRLTDVVYNLLNFMNSELKDLQRWIANETKEGRGTSTTNLSIYSIILQSAINQNPNGFKTGLSSANKLKVFITDEVTIPKNIILEKNQRIVRI